MRPVFAWMLLAALASAGVMLFVSFQLGVFLLVFAAVGWWVWQNPEEGFLLFVIIAPLLSMFKATQTVGVVTLVKDVIILVLVLRVVLFPLFTKRLSYRRSILFGPAAALAAWTVLQTLRAESLALGILRARDIILYLLLYFVVLYLPANKEIWVNRLRWFTLSFAVSALHAGYQWFWVGDSAVLRFDPGRSIWIPRISSTFGHPSVYGEYLVAAAVLFASCALFLQKKWRIAFGGLFLITLPIIFLTYSRAVWIGFAVAVGIIGVIWTLRHLQGVVRVGFIAASGVLGTVLIIGLLRFTPVGSLLRSAFDPTYKSNQERLEFAARLIAPMSNVDAIIGRGLGDVIQQQLRKVDVGAEEIAAGASRDVQLAKNATLVDNQYLKSFVEIGLLGLVIYFWLFWRFARGTWELARQFGGRHKQIIALSSAGFLAAFVVQGLVIDIWDIFPTNAMFWIVGGLVSAALTTYTSSDERRNISSAG